MDETGAEKGEVGDKETVGLLNLQDLLRPKSFFQ